MKQFGYLVEYRVSVPDKDSSDEAERITYDRLITTLEDNDPDFGETAASYEPQALAGYIVDLFQTEEFEYLVEEVDDNVWEV